MSNGYHETAQICRNGHAITSRYESGPERRQDYCDKCGESTITKCPSCNTSIRGDHRSPGIVVMGFPYKTPRFCHKCGKPYPWTETQLRIAREFADEISELTAEEKEVLKESLASMVADSPRTTLAVTRFKKLMSKAGSTVADGLKSIMVDIASETVKKTLWS